ncbi:N-acetylmuramoyl-L-alanine amidase [Desulfobotulus alkaliphilus]|uniref:N-acetylmuramoyl-L-alanine amidase n=1 Tax=Desulfobotulus alkaliphilus TaxID=622671 RepID=A0A562S7M5_9BACT|nr:N-acetylmuramoyl-L-alanine amidase [Desulfobotulus alkaliphilus]TWI77407.1 N-acetylmuramoyl-L-alanine amidase [Desulfobotulus alkaliphilus]
MVLPTYRIRVHRNISPPCRGKKAMRIPVLCILIACLFFSCFPAWAGSVRDLYLRADRDFQELQKNTERRKFRANWEKVADAFESAYMQDPQNAWAPASLYRAGEVYLGLSHFSGRSSDKEKAIELFRRVFHECPKSRYKFRAEGMLRELGAPLQAPPPPRPVIQAESKPQPPLKTARSTRPDEAPPAESSLPAPPIPALPVPDAGIQIMPVIEKTKTPSPQNAEDISHLGMIQGVRYQTHANRTRIVVDSDRELAYTFNDLNRDRERGLPPRVYVDFKQSTLKEDIPPSTQINDPQVKAFRIARNTKEKVRLVMDLDQTRDFKVFQLFDPYRTVIDIWGETGSTERTALAASLPPAALPPVATTPPSASAIRRQLALGVHRIVIDPGHGGKDPGAIGYQRGVLEKDINLQISKILADKLRKELNCEVILTRDSDVYLSLEERTRFANQHKADLFLSIHTNAAMNRNAHGIETYFLNLATDEESIAVAARENATSTKNISDLQTILNDLMQNAKINESSRLASYVQRGMVDSVKPHYSNIRDNGVKQAPFYVLLGAQMPSILIEAGFITNPRECQRLTTPQYQNRIADGIVEGIRRYIQEHFPQNTP